MTAAFKQFYIPAVSLFVESPNLPYTEIQNLDGNGLRFDWSVSRDNTGDADQAEVTIYNLSRTVAGQLHKAWGDLAVGFTAGIKIGWQGVAQLLLKGNTWDLSVDGRDGADYLTTFKIGDGHNPIRDSVWGRSINGAKLNIALEQLVSLPVDAQDIGGGGLGFIYPKESADLVAAAAARTSISDYRNLVPGMSTVHYVNDIMATLGLEWRVHNGAFIAMRGGIINEPGPILRPERGLLKYKSKNDGGITVDALANPDVQPGIQIQVQDNQGKNFAEPVYRVESVEFTGSSIGESVMSIQAAKGILTNGT
jgi:hypothetical protein